MSDTPPIDPDLAERLRPFTSELRALADHLDATPADPEDPHPQPEQTAGRTEITPEMMSDLLAERDASREARLRPTFIETN